MYLDLQPEKWLAQILSLGSNPIPNLVNFHVSMSNGNVNFHNTSGGKKDVVENEDLMRNDENVLFEIKERTTKLINDKPVPDAGTMYEHEKTLIPEPCPKCGENLLGKPEIKLELWERLPNYTSPGNQDKENNTTDKALITNVIKNERSNLACGISISKDFSQ